jgi:hypothetical protein
MNAIFNIVAFLLDKIHELTGWSYNEVNILFYYLLVPLIYLFLADRIIRKKYILSIGWILLWAVFLIFVRDFSQFSDDLFDASARFLNSFSWLGWNYTVASVMICVIFPGIVFLVLCWFAFPKVFRRKRSNPA